MFSSFVASFAIGKCFFSQNTVASLAVRSVVVGVVVVVVVVVVKLCGNVESFSPGCQSTMMHTLKGDLRRRLNAHKIER